MAKKTTEVKNKKVKINYSRASEYRAIPISGAWGGLTSQGLVHAELFVEHQTHPKEEEIERVRCPSS